MGVPKLSYLHGSRSRFSDESFRNTQFSPHQIDRIANPAISSLRILQSYELGYLLEPQPFGKAQSKKKAVTRMKCLKYPAHGCVCLPQYCLCLRIGRRVDQLLSKGKFRIPV